MPKTRGPQTSIKIDILKDWYKNKKYLTNAYRYNNATIGHVEVALEIIEGTLNSLSQEITQQQAVIDAVCSSFQLNIPLENNTFNCHVQIASKVLRVLDPFGLNPTFVLDETPIVTLVGETITPGQTLAISSAGTGFVVLELEIQQGTVYTGGMVLTT